MSELERLPEAPFLGTRNEPLTKRRHKALIGGLKITLLVLTCLSMKTYSHSTSPCEDKILPDLIPPPGSLFHEGGLLYGNSCKVTPNAKGDVSCNAAFYLTCDMKTSKCICEAGMSIDVSGTGRCLEKAGEKCTNYVGNGLPIKYCTRNAECLQDSSGEELRCYCKIPLLPNFFGACTATYARPCITNSECSTRSFLKCGQRKTCICDFENDSQVWNATLLQCASLIGADCTVKGRAVRPCVDPTKSSCHEDVSGGICKCNPGFIPTSENHRCGIPYNGFCDTTADCADRLVCGHRGLERTCGCQNPKEQFYDIVHGQCVAYAGASCIDADGNLLECVEGATCRLLLPQNSTTMCSCNENFHEENRFCVLNSARRVQNLGLAVFTVSVLIIISSFCMN